MREILFRGKSTDNGEWVEGLPCYAIDGQISEIETFNSFASCTITEVNPETVGQYTGLTDKNGKNIFEEDVISLHTLYNNETTVEVVHFNNGGFFAGTYPIYNVGAPSNQNNIVLLGNIHDNPKLMEVQR